MQKRRSLMLTVLGALVALSAVLVVLIFAGRGPAPAYVAGLRQPPPTSENSLHAEDRFEAVDGVELFEQWWLPKAGAPRALLVIHHGLKDHSDRYVGFAEGLAARGFAVYAYDMRGHGDSAGPRVWVGSFDEYLGDLDLALARARTKFVGEVPTFLMGHSMGGAITTRYAMEYDSQLAGLVLSAPALKNGAGAAIEVVSSVLGSLAPGLPVLELDNASFSKDPKVVAAMGADPLVFQGGGAAQTGDQLLRAMEKIQAEPERVKVPLLILHGTEDKLTEIEGSRALAKRAGTRDVTLKEYPGLWHDLLHEPEGAQVAADVTAWLEARAPAVAAPPLPSPSPSREGDAGLEATSDAGR